jgi:hypothetical protein
VIAQSVAELEPPAVFDADFAAALDASQSGSPHKPNHRDEFLDYVSGVVGELSSAGTIVFEALRWRYGSASPHRPYASRGAQFSLDGQSWHYLPTRIHVLSKVLEGAPRDEGSQALVQAMLDRDFREPIAHKLLREAMDVSMANQRSAIVIGVAAAESGFKQLVADLVPHAAWLISSVPSPPLERMLRNYLPTLPVRNSFNGAVEKPPSYVRTLVRNAVEERNRIAHAGAEGIVGEGLTETLDAIRDLLYLFDFYGGFGWAKDMLSARFMRELGT